MLGKKLLLSSLLLIGKAKAMKREKVNRFGFHYYEMYMGLNIPNNFAQMTQPENVDYLIIPRVSSENRRYVPIGFMSSDVISSDAVQKGKIGKTAKAILDARAKYSDCSLADMYGEKMYLFPELLKVHQENDRAVMQAYGFSVKDMTESRCVAELMKMYQETQESK